METRSFNAVDSSTFLLRSKEEAHDYRYFPEPDLQPTKVEKKYIEKVKETLPQLPNELFKHYTEELGLSNYDANIIVEDKEFALYFNELSTLTKNYKAAANWLNGPIKSHLNKNAITLEELEFMKPASVAEIIQLIDDGKVSNSVAEQKIFPIKVATSENSLTIAEKNNLIQESGDNEIDDYINQVIEENPSEVERYKNGEKQLTGFLSVCVSLNLCVCVLCVPSFTVCVSVSVCLFLSVCVYV